MLQRSEESSPKSVGKVSNSAEEDVEYAKENTSGQDMVSFFDQAAISRRENSQYGAKSLFSIKRIFEERAKQCGTEKKTEFGGTLSQLILGKNSQEDVSRQSSTLGRSVSGRNAPSGGVHARGTNLFATVNTLEVKTPTDSRPCSQLTGNAPLSSRKRMTYGGFTAACSVATTPVVGGGDNAYFSNLKRSLSKNSLMNQFKNLTESERRRVKVEIIRGSVQVPGKGDSTPTKENAKPRTS